MNNFTYVLSKSWIWFEQNARVSNPLPPPSRPRKPKLPVHRPSIFFSSPSSARDAWAPAWRYSKFPRKKLWFRGCLPLRSKTHNKTRILIETSAYWATYLFLTGYLALKLLIILSTNQVQTWSTVTESLTFDKVSVSFHEPKLGHFRRRFPNKIGSKMMQITQGSL